MTVLAVFQRLDAQPDLYMNVFGESVLNDAVGMVLYNVLAEVLCQDDSLGEPQSGSHTRAPTHPDSVERLEVLKAAAQAVTAERAAAAAVQLQGEVQ